MRLFNFAIPPRSRVQLRAPALFAVCARVSSRGGKRSGREGGVAAEIRVICAGYFSANCNLDPLELEFWEDFRTHDTPHKGLHYAFFKISKSLNLS